MASGVLVIQSPECSYFESSISPEKYNMTISVPPKYDASLYFLSQKEGFCPDVYVAYKSHSILNII